LNFPWRAGEAQDFKLTHYRFGLCVANPRQPAAGSCIRTGGSTRSGARATAEDHDAAPGIVYLFTAVSVGNLNQCSAFHTAYTDRRGARDLGAAQPSGYIAMKRTFASALRRASRLMRPRKPTKTMRKIQKSMTGAMVKAAMAPLTTPKAKNAAPRKMARSGATPGVASTHVRLAQASLPSALSRPEPRTVAPRVPDGARYIHRKHRSAAGSRGYKLYVPASGLNRPVGLILMLHGCGQTPDDFAVGTRMNALAERHALVIAYPEQTSRHNAASCWNWFKPAHQSRDAGEPAILAALTRKLMREFGLGRDAVFVAGLSAGGSMAAILADVYPDVFSAVGLHSGLARGSARNAVSAMTAMRKGGKVQAATAPALDGNGQRVRRIIFQGDADSTVHPSNAATLVAAALESDAVPIRTANRTFRERGYARSGYAAPDGTVMIELWMIEGAGHAWSGGRKAGSYTDSKGPDASAQMVRFFLT
jgi:poly(hydroxyalkanoate) depolymerase family esterase